MIRVRCLQGFCEGASTSHLPDLTTPPLVPLRPGQCIVLGQEDVLPLKTPDIWLDNLYVRALYRNAPANVTREDAFLAMIPVPGRRLLDNFTREEPPTRYLTRMTLQGDNLGNTVGVFGDESVYIEGATTVYEHLSCNVSRTAYTTVSYP